MEVFFATKEENNKRREEEFLKLSPEERLMNYFDRLFAPRTTPLSDDYMHPNEKKGNFVLRRNDEA